MSQPPGQQPWPPHQPHFPGQNHPVPAPRDSTNLVLGLVLGTIIGTVLGGILTLTIFFASLESLQTVAVPLSILVPFLVPIPLLFFKNTRPWAFGLLMGVALGSVILAGSCVWFIGELESAH
ncbi:hypothetical protein BJ980_001048 [Nocardioides daedukensis]|uniref:Uncharacterized protein n=1 Tax=Nocardioides daedukensis TaxID=634462 RepID=A0A7Y9UVN5_9ACTN|nr:hypothetical protein [Nocardioides daedukensis]NYG58125.1 hypothetical protein [Nocardioides daedukensis]